jgi:thiamine biosynthesis lipoprotein ApbE
MRDLSLREAIDAVAVVVQDLVDAEFAKAGVVEPGSALDQIGLKRTGYPWFATISSTENSE